MGKERKFGVKFGVSKTTMLKPWKQGFSRILSVGC